MSQGIHPSIEKMKLEDLPEVLAIEKASFPIPFSEDLFRMELQLEVAHLSVARWEGKLVGYIDFWRVDAEIYLITIAVHPEWRQKAIGASLMEVMIQEARKDGVLKITLDVRPSNVAGLALYHHYGFEQVGIRKAYYQDNQEDALVLSLALA